MAKTIRRRGRNVNSGSDGAAATNKVAATTTGPPQIQELQDLMDSQKNKIHAVKEAYSQQNSQLAKYNSSLLMKLTDFEKKISELLQENVILRSKVSMSEINYKERLNEKISVLEDGISQRFEEIFHMFNSIRRKENLPTATLGNSGPKSILRNKRSRQSSGRASSIHFQPEGSVELKNSEEVQVKKKRKSSRRESIFIPGDFEFTYDEDFSTLDQVEQQPAFELAHSLVHQEDGHQENEQRESEHRESEPRESHQENEQRESEHRESESRESHQENKQRESEHRESHQENEQRESEYQEAVFPDDHEAKQFQAEEEYLRTVTPQIENGSNGSINFTNSIIDYSIPEEIVTNEDPVTSANAETPASSSKLDIFKDELESPAPHPLNPSAPAANANKINDAPFMPLEASQSKIKHSMRQLNTKTRKKKFDEVMPSTNGNGACNLDFPRTRRTRGKAIDYTLPSLRAKMRRPSEKLVDATTITNIQDLQVTHSEKKCSKNNSRKSTISPDRTLELNAQPGEPKRNAGMFESVEKKEPTKDDEQNARQKNSKSMEFSAGSITDNIIERDSLSGGKVGYEEKSSLSSKALKDITNTPKPKITKTKKLLKNAIINDLSDRPEDSNNSSHERCVSFRLHEEDLSVFDLIGSEKVRHPQKTYRAKSRRKV